MSTLSQDDKLQTVSFRVPEDFKIALDVLIAQRQTTLEEICVRTLSSGLGLNLPEKYPPKLEESKRRRT